MNKRLRMTVDDIITGIGSRIVGDKSIDWQDACDALEEIESYCETAREGILEDQKEAKS